MSVGANSIKRAAKTAAAEEPKEADRKAEDGRGGAAKEKNVQEKDAVEKIVTDKDGEKAASRGRSAKTAGKKPEPKSGRKAEAKLGKKPASRAAGTAPRNSSRVQQAAPAGEADAVQREQAHEAYGIGQELPVHLL